MVKTLALLPRRRKPPTTRGVANHRPLQGVPGDRDNGIIWEFGNTMSAVEDNGHLRKRLNEQL